MPSTPLSNLLIFDTPEQVATAAAERFVTHASRALEDHGVFSVALSGGSTPRQMYRVLASEPFKSAVAWKRVHLFFGDERNVPRDHSESNYRMANEALISQVPIPPENLHPIDGEGDAEDGAKKYQMDLKAFFNGQDWPRFDLVLLGMGEDGHTASLFPHSLALKERERWTTSNFVEKLATFRITLTAAAINAAANVEFLVTGSNKAASLAAVVNGRRDPENLPAQLIQPLNGDLTWLVDKAAASQLR
jgi:6-phosphogluconolactonase